VRLTRAGFRLFQWQRSEERYLLEPAVLGFRCQVSGVGEQMTEDRGQRTENRGQRADGRGQRAEGREQRTEGRGQMTDDRGQKVKNRSWEGEKVRR